MPLCAALGALFAFPTSAHAQTGLLDHRSAEFASHEGNIAFLALGVGLPLLRDRADGKDHTLRTTDALVTSGLAAYALKALTREARPDGSGDHDSFPSGHATAAFAVAAMESRFHPHEAPLWFLGAALIGDSRIQLKRHHLHDVVAGALLGYGTAQGEAASRRGLVLSPFVSSDSRGRLSLHLGGTF